MSNCPEPSTVFDNNNNRNYFVFQIFIKMTLYLYFSRCDIPEELEDEDEAIPEEPEVKDEAIPEEPEDEDEALSGATYKKTFKKQQ
jgi:hypothetical protein